MKRITKLLVFIALAVLGTFPLQSAQTNLVQTLQIRLAAYSQGPATTNGNLISTTVNVGSLFTPGIIQMLGAATSNTFSPKATLLVVRPLPDGDPMVVVRDGATTVGVTRFFSHEVSDPRIAQDTVNTNTGVSAGREYSYHVFALTNADSQVLTSHFVVSGLARATFVSLLNRQGAAIGAAYEYVAAVSGSGDVNGTEALFQGTISGLGRKIEIVP